jgi:thiamine pyrophosphate-dependent acetolactate synthase large subunit-like protein
MTKAGRVRRLAEALGGHGATVRSQEDLDQALKLIAGRDRPLLLGLKLDPYQMGDVQHQPTGFSLP